MLISLRVSGRDKHLLGIGSGGVEEMSVCGRRSSIVDILESG